MNMILPLHCIYLYQKEEKQDRKYSWKPRAKINLSLREANWNIMIIVPELWFRWKWIVNHLERSRKLHHKSKVVRSQFQYGETSRSLLPTINNAGVVWLYHCTRSMFWITIKSIWPEHLQVFKPMGQLLDAKSTCLLTSKDPWFYLYHIFPFLSFSQMCNFLLTLQNILCLVTRATRGWTPINSYRNTPGRLSFLTWCYTTGPNIGTLSAHHPFL